MSRPEGTILALHDVVSVHSHWIEQWRGQPVYWREVAQIMQPVVVTKILSLNQVEVSDLVTGEKLIRSDKAAKKNAWGMDYFVKNDFLTAARKALKNQ